jgi:hypothetical protein
MGNQAIGFNRLGSQPVLQDPDKDQGYTDKKQADDEIASNTYSFLLTHIGTAILQMSYLK